MSINVLYQIEVIKRVAVLPFVLLMITVFPAISAAQQSSTENSTVSREYSTLEWTEKRSFSPAVITEGGKTVWLAGVTAPFDGEGNSLAGDFDAQETILQCPCCKSIYGSEQLQSLVPSQGKFGFDIIVKVGQALFLQCRNDTDIQQALFKENNVSISLSEINHLGKKFIV